MVDRRLPGSFTAAGAAKYPSPASATLGAQLPLPTVPSASGGLVTNASGDVGVGATPGSGGIVSGTNTQVAGVDEADLVETDGRYIYSLQDSELVVTDAAPAADMHVVARYDTDGNGPRHLLAR